MPIMSFIANDSPRSCVEFSPLTFLKNIEVSYLVECPLVWDFLMFPHGKIEIMHFFIGTSKKCCFSSVRHIRRYMVPVHLITGCINSDPLVKLVIALFLH